MAAPNYLPLFIRAGINSNNNGTGMNQLITAAVGSNYDGTNGNYALMWTADPTNGGFLSFIRAKAGGSNVASVARLFLNNGSTPGTATNNQFIGEISLPATTATNVAATPEVDYMLNRPIEPGFRIYVGLGTAVSAGWVFTGFGGKY